MSVIGTASGGSSQQCWLWVPLLWLCMTDPNAPFLFCARHLMHLSEWCCRTKTGMVKDRRSLNYVLGSSGIKHRVRHKHGCSVKDIYSSWWSYVLLLSLSLWCAFVLWFLFDTEDFGLFKILEWVFYKWKQMWNAPLTWLVSCFSESGEEGLQYVSASGV